MYERIILSEDIVRGYVPGTSDARIKDANTRGLMLMVLRSGRKVWRYRYMINGRSTTLDGGIWPKVSVDAAREWARNQSSIRAEGDDPIDTVIASTPSKAHQATFERRAREWHERASKVWSEQYREATLRLFVRDVFPAMISRSSRLRFGQLKLDQIEPRDVLEVCQSVEARGALDVAADVCRLIGQVCKWAKLRGYCKNDNPARDVPSGMQKRTRTHFAALSYAQLAQFFRDFAGYNSREHTKIGLELMILLAPRTDELREMRWSEVRFDERMIRVPPSRMKDQQARRKADGDYLIPLTDHALELLRQLQAITGHGDLLFPGVEMDEPISNGTWLQMIKRMGYRNKATIHGFRALLSTTANEAGFNPKVVDRQLDHVEKNQTSAAYNRAEYMDLRTELMQWWTDQVLRAKQGATHYITKTKYEGGADIAPVVSKRGKRAPGGTREAIAADFF